MSQIEMYYKNYISEDVIAGTPRLLVEGVKQELIFEIKRVEITDNYEDVCTNLRMATDILQLLAEHIEDDFIELLYNPMGCWYKCDNKEDNDYWKERCRKEAWKNYNLKLKN